MRNLAIWSGLLLAAIASGLLLGAGSSRDIAVVAFVAVLCVVWWVTEPIPIPATSLLPLAILPLMGVLTPAQVGEAYGSPIILLLLGGFLLSQAMEHSGAHRRIAIGMVNLFGAQTGQRLVLGFMAAAAVLSMWISNTATTLMLLPVVLAVLDATPDRQRLAMPLLLGVAYAASVGGVGTPIGTPPNLIFMQVFEETTGRSISFTTWMSWAVPVVVVMVPLMALILTRNARGPLTVSLPSVGAWRSEEKRVLLVFAITALAWITRSEPFGGWKTWLDLPQANDASVALLAVVLMFLLPNGKGGRLLTWERAVTIPWGALLLFGGGICLAKGFVSSGLSDLMGGLFIGLADLPLYAVILIIALLVTFMTETTSNTASTTLLMPVLAAAGFGAGIAPEILMVPAAMSASCAFMLPVATAPNTVVYSSGEFTIKQMAREGLVLNLLGALVISVVCYWRLT
ncbi:SLC13/DASS family transporter [Pseudohalioglobus sediminis]|uniref:SLC13/DASS family transporter n=1 Tax=Pseudohalioglobus sediminis TaxID=2606449 RepID=A0A5B0WUQ7_9GAMM|nr:SLC13 family permease [Pseudohalioglobus sediminis]KAA1189931.1 SLC13/DASS family transporter [Pseudohalioglobus sediminis]